MRIKGIALEPDTETVGASQIRKVYTEDGLKRATETFEGAPIHASSSPEAQRVIGWVIYAEYVEGKGVVYEGMIEDGEMSDRIRDGLSDVAPKITHEPLDAVDEVHTISRPEFKGLFLTPATSDAVPGITKAED